MARTAQRPLPAGDVSLTEAWIWLFAQVGIGFLVWLALPMGGKIIALLSIPLVAAYPYMKRITWWPQAWLGMTFNWGFPVGYLTAGGNDILWPVLFYVGLIAWTIGYDTLYARQDVEDDALMGIRSTARLFGDHSLSAISLIYAASVLFLGLAMMNAGPRIPGIMIATAYFAHLFYQIVVFRMKGDVAALKLFKSNRDAGLLVVFGLIVTVVLSLQG